MATSSGDTKIMSCTCTHEFQDQRYGRGQRLFNATSNSFRCTVCGTSKDSGAKKK